MVKPRLTREAVIKRLKSAERQIADLGVRRLALFGSVMRNEARPDSDVRTFMPHPTSATSAV